VRTDKAGRSGHDDAHTLTLTCARKPDQTTWCWDVPVSPVRAVDNRALHASDTKHSNVAHAAHAPAVCHLCASVPSAERYSVVVASWLSTSLRIANNSSHAHGA
jgi:hypothetical protein